MSFDEILEALNRVICRQTMIHLCRRIILFVCISLCGLAVQLRAADKPAVLVVSNFGAKGDGKTLDTAAIQKAIDQAHGAGGGVVKFPKGTYRSGTVELKSGVTLHFAKDAMLLGSSKLTDYRRGHWPALVLATGQQNIGITGPGMLNGNSPELVKEFDRIKASGNALEFLPTARRGEKMSFGSPIGSPTEIDPYALQAEGKLMDFVYHMGTRPTEAVRPQIVEFRNCTNVVMQDITLRDAANWVQSYRSCEGLTFERVKVRSKNYWNNDGIDIVDCRRMTMVDCDIDSADDALCFKSEWIGAGCEDITVKRVKLASHASAIKFGTASHHGFKRIHISDVTISDAYRSAVAIQCVDGAVVEDITVERLKAVNVGNAIALRLGHRNQNKPPGVLRRVTLRDLDVEVRPENPGEHMESGIAHNQIPSSIVGIPGHQIEDVRLEKIRIQAVGGGQRSKAEIKLDALDTVPENIRDYPEFSMWGELPAWGMYVRHANGITFRDVRFETAQADFRPAIVADGVVALEFHQINLGAGSGEPLIVLKDSPDAKVDGVKSAVKVSETIRRLPALSPQARANSQQP